MDYTQSGSDILLKQPDFGLDDTAALCIIHKIQLLFIIKSSNLLAKFYKKYYTINISIFQADKINIS